MTEEIDELGKVVQSVEGGTDRPQDGDNSTGEENPTPVDGSPETGIDNSTFPTPTDKSKSIFDRLKSGEPNTPIEQVESPFEKQFWKQYLMRGIQKATGMDDEPAWFDFVRGIAGGVIEQSEQQDAKPPDEDQANEENIPDWVGQ